MTPAALTTLTTALTIPWQARREHHLYIRRRGPRRNAPGAGAPPRLDLTDHLLATILHERLSLPQYVIATLFAADPTTISHAINLTRRLLAQHTTPIQPAPVKLRTLDDLRQYATAAGITLPANIKPAVCY